MNLNDRFNTLHDNLKLDTIERARAEVFHNRLDAILVESGLATRTRLQGSFARKTMLPPLKDIDKIIELSDELREVLDGPNGPAKAMAMVRDVLAPRLPDSEFEFKKHALGITVPNERFDFDAVPAFNPEDGTNWIDIADTEDEDWEPSNTYVLIQTIANRNQACNAKFIHQVRMVKQAFHVAGLGGVIPGLHVETYVYEGVDEELGHPVAVARSLRAAANLIGTRYTDPTGADYISDRLVPEDVAAAKPIIAQLADSADRAVDLEKAGHATEAACVWADIFGPTFPRPSGGNRDYLNQLHRGAPVVAASPTPQTPSTRAWRHP